MALEAGENLSGKKPPAFAYDEKTFPELKRSLARTIRYLKTIHPKDIAKNENKKVQTFLRPKKKFLARQYVLTLALPNFFFHVTTTYDILRHLGMPLKKQDYLGESL